MQIHKTALRRRAAAGSVAAAMLFATVPTAALAAPADTDADCPPAEQPAADETAEDETPEDETPEDETPEDETPEDETPEDDPNAADPNAADPDAGTGSGGDDSGIPGGDSQNPFAALDHHILDDEGSNLECTTTTVDDEEADGTPETDENEGNDTPETDENEGNDTPETDENEGNDTPETDENEGNDTPEGGNTDEGGNGTIGTPNRPVAKPVPALTDVPSNNAHQTSIEKLYRYGITIGTGDTTYNPGGEMTRQQMATFLVRLLQHADASVPTPANHAESMAILKDRNIFVGDLHGNLHGAAKLNRAQGAALLVRTIEHVNGTELPVGEARFTDVGGTHAVNINKLAKAGIVSGYANDTFRPANPLRRDQMATLVSKSIDRLIHDGKISAL
ncbi:S-layer homology domain-containing protein [Egicoccus halophilus]|uniref:S-layer homology domain-containing protein n=1 Tax=Egicoccus halophilus TaxID=1670830 RepID=UPI0010316257|nr:S-layer homology domain-containing protein [Egicoccus halophilus]